MWFLVEMSLWVVPKWRLSLGSPDGLLLNEPFRGKNLP